VYTPIHAHTTAGIIVGYSPRSKSGISNTQICKRNNLNILRNITYLDTHSLLVCVRIGKTQILLLEKSHTGHEWW
jgi:hypothetical protein